VDYYEVLNLRLVGTAAVDSIGGGDDVTQGGTLDDPPPSSAGLRRNADETCVRLLSPAAVKAARFKHHALGRVAPPFSITISSV
jgi:hypothetical protein